MLTKSSSANALTVFGPEVLHAGLVSDLDAFIGRKTGAKLVDRFFCMHDANSIHRFYELTGSTNGAHWPLVVDLFDGRPCLVSIWAGSNVLAELQALKGATRPCEADAASVRGGFACDNPVCNLVHVSDSPDLAVEELTLLRSRKLVQCYDCAGEASTGSGADAVPRHSALYTFAAMLCRLEPTVRRPQTVRITAPASTTAAALFGHLIEISRTHKNVADLVCAFLEGRREEALASLPSGFQLTAWERLLIECGCHSNPHWSRRLNLAVAPEAVQCL